MAKISNMHIVYTIGSLQKAGGVERVLISKANYLVENNFTVTVLIAQQEPGQFAYPVSPHVKIIYMNINNVDSIWIKIPVFGFFLKVRMLRSLYQKTVNKIKPDVIINVERGFEDFILPGLNPHVPCVRECHSSLQASEIKVKIGSEGLKGRFFTALYSRQLTKFDRVVLLTEQDKIYRNFKNGNTVIPNLVAEFPTVAEYDTTSTTAISVGRLDQFKNFSDQIVVWRSVVDLYPEWTLEIFGDGPERNRLQELIITLGLSENVFLRGKTSSVDQHLKRSSFFLFTSVAEGFGMVLAEAMQMGLPVVSYSCPCGPADIISHGVDGFLVDVGEREKFAEYVLMLIREPDRRRQMSAAALKKSELFSEKHIMPKWIEFFNDLVNERS